MVTSQGVHVRELVWTVAGASVGSLARYWVGQLWSVRALEPMLVLTAAAAGVVGFSLVASIRASIRTVLIAAGGAASSISAVATLAATSTPTQSVIRLVGFFACAVAGVLVGMLAAASVPSTQPEEPH